VHHAKGVHAYNYSDLPLFDILFGTFKNPSRYVSETGFYQGASERISDMLLFKDVSVKDNEERQIEEYKGKEVEVKKNIVHEGVY
jgi:sterol desaturase/sphingolipid hydroxylase (fatty acid hydroxylase superfamily)